MIDIINVTIDMITIIVTLVSFDVQLAQQPQNSDCRPPHLLQSFARRTPIESDDHYSDFSPIFCMMVYYPHQKHRNIVIQIFDF
jgi:hypothetical protein